MSTLLDLARFVLGGIALGYLAAFIGAGAVLGVKAVSYTHLTLPTTPYV